MHGQHRRYRLLSRHIPSSRCQSNRQILAWRKPCLFEAWTFDACGQFACSRSGGARRDRTDDLLLAKQALSQLSYGPVSSQFSQACASQSGARHQELVGLERFELSTSRLSSARSNQLSYRPKIWPGKRAGCPSEERETKAAVSRKWSQRLAPHLAPDVSKGREREQP